MSLLYPTVYRRRVTDVRVEELQRLGVTGVLLDVDNTLTTHDAPEVSAEVGEWLCRMQEAGLRPVIVSNNKDERVRPFAERVGVPYVAKAGKPLGRGLRRAAVLLGLPRRQCAVIGDQIFTDILGANLAGMPSFLLEPIEPEVEQRFIVFKRRIERWLLRCPRQVRRKGNDYAH